MKGTKIYLTGFILILCFNVLLQGTIIFDNKLDDKENKDDFSLLIKSSSLKREWECTWGGVYDEYGSEVAIDSLNNVYCVGETWSFGAGSIDMVLVKYDGNGNQQWNRTWGGIAPDSGLGVAVDSSNNVYCVGETVSFGAGSADLVLVKFDRNGNQQWNRTWGGVDSDASSDVAVDSAGNVYCVGITESFGSGFYDILLVKYDGNGNQQWNRTWGGVDYDFGTGVVVDLLGNIYCGGYTESFGVGSYDLVLVKFDENGAQQWNRTWGGVNNDLAIGIAIDSSSNVYCGGYTESFGAGLSDFVLVKFDEHGVRQWNCTWGGADSDIGEGLMVDSLSNVYIIGNTQSFGEGDSDMALVKYDKNGVQQWNRTWGGVDYDLGTGVVVDSSSNIYCGGYTDSYGAGSYDMVLVKFSQEIYEPAILGYNIVTIIIVSWFLILFSLYYIRNKIKYRK